jgi:hypothetical protein
MCGMHVFVVFGCTQLKNIVLIAANFCIISDKCFNNRAREYTTETASLFRNSQCTTLFNQLNVQT